MNASRNALLNKQRMAQYASQPQSRLTSVTAPVGGLNTRDAINNMPATDAVSMVNWFPNGGSVDVRKGTAQRYVGIGSSDVLTIAEYFSGTNRKMLAASQTNIYDAAKTPPYATSAVYFDGVNDYMLRGAGITGAVDGKNVSGSFWYKPNSVTGVQKIFEIQNASGSSTIGIDISYTSGKFRVIGRNSAGAQIFEIVTASTYVNTSLYYNVLFSVNLATGATNLYINNVSDNSSPSTTNDNIDLTTTDTSFGAATNGNNKITASISEFWFTNEFIDLSSAPNRAKFIDSNGLPVGLGTTGNTPTGTAALVYLNGDYITFGTNAGTGGNFTVTGALTAASNTPTGAGLSLLSGQTSGRWQTANFMSNMLWVNGQDAPQVFGGSTFTSWNGSCSGMTTTSVIGCNVYRNRMYVWMANDSNFFYSATQTIGGTYVKFQLGDVANHGGNITSIKTLSHDGGNGPSDYLVIFMSSGDTIVYSGDPASTFTLVGIYKIPPPMGIRSVIKYGGDILIQTAIDYVLFSQIVDGVYKQPSKMHGAMQDASTNYASNSGWQLLYWPEGGMVIGNIPVSTTVFDQHVFNVLENAWTTYEDINARCWGLYNGNLYFGAGDGSIYQAETGNSDNGSDISTDVQQAWNPGGYGGRKQVQAYRPVMTAEGTLTYESGIAYDYGTVNVTSTSSQASVGAAWDTSDWDTTDWSPETQIKQSWNGANGIGFMVGLRIRTQTSGQAVSWFRTDLTSVPAGAI